MKFLQIMQWELQITMEWSFGNRTYQPISSHNYKTLGKWASYGKASSWKVEGGYLLSVNHIAKILEIFK